MYIVNKFVRFEVFTVMKIGILPEHYMVSQPRKTWSCVGSDYNQVANLQNFASYCLHYKVTFNFMNKTFCY
jgi:hypothetical protein